METAAPAPKKEVVLSIVIPITKRFDDVGDLYRSYKAAADSLDVPYEMIYVLDGPRSDAYRSLKGLKERGEKFSIITHARCFGESTAITTGVRQAQGDLIMTLPAYIQVEPAEIPKLYRALGENDMVVVRRWPRCDSLLNRFQTRLFHWIVRFLTDVRYGDVGCSLRIMKKRIFTEISLYGDLHRFIPVLAQKQGFRVREIDLRQSAREKRVRMYPAGTYVRRLIDLLTVFFLVKFTRKPLRFFGLTGSMILVSGVAISGYLVVGRLWFDVSLSDRPLLLLGVLLIVLGIQVFAIGLVGEIIIFAHAKDIKEYTIEEIIN